MKYSRTTNIVQTTPELRVEHIQLRRTDEWYAVGDVDRKNKIRKKLGLPLLRKVMKKNRDWYNDLILANDCYGE